MADKKSCEGKMTTLECIECGYREVFTEKQFQLTDGLRCYVCEGLVRPAITRPDEPIRNRRMKGKKRISVGEVTVDIDVSDALKGLKAVQREARKTIKLLKEVEHLQEVYINDDSTNQ